MNVSSVKEFSIKFRDLIHKKFPAVSPRQSEKDLQQDEKDLSQFYKEIKAELDRDGLIVLCLSFREAR